MNVAATSDSTELRVACIRRTGTMENEESHNCSNDDSSNDDVEHPSPDCELTLSVGQWVSYNEAEYPGEITLIENNDIEVNVMHKSGWPSKADKIFYECKKILHVVDPPKAAGHRGQFLFEDLKVWDIIT